MAGSLAGEMLLSPPPSSSTPSAGILSLPHEVLSVVISYCDRPSALALVRVCRRFAPLNIEQHLWRHLSLTTPDLPSKPITPGHEANEAEEASLSRLIWKVGEIAERADKGRCGMVRSVEMEPHPGALSGIADLLGRVSGTLKVLILVRPNPPVTYLHPTSFDRVLLDTDITFPSLEKLVIGDNTTCCAGFVPYLCGLAPHLHTLIVHVPDLHRCGNPSYPTPKPHPKLKQLYICSKRRNEKDDVDTSFFRSLLQHLPSLLQLSIDFPLHTDKYDSRDTYLCNEEDVREINGGYYRRQAMTVIVNMLRMLRSVEDLEWRNVEAWTFHRTITGHAFPRLRRLVLGPVEWDDWVNLWVKIPTLEAIFFNGLRIASPARVIPTLEQIRHLMMILRECSSYPCPCLRLLHVLSPHTLEPGLDIFSQLDQIEASADPNGVISSYHHGEAKVFHARLLVQLPSVIKDYVDYNGLIVPLDVLERMRVADGRTEGEWRRRGVEVGDEGWEVLMAWERELAA